MLYDIQSEIQLTLKSSGFDLSKCGLTVAPSKLSEAVVTCIQGVLSLNLGHDTNYPDFFLSVFLNPSMKMSE
ncbi:hypothetical protein B7P43_G03507 [Cryptotermes secundus]|uniref:Uncharacterized protein n=1 Tax=Cryptotermes secundus TaxID=105785 RepID=A0A2J7RG52_9NEOP|nr:hypothetical protein B7P43_G03507 [Cryptotermes secundus]